MSRRVFTITELRRTGAGVISPTPTVFRWTPETHAAPVGEIPLELMVTTVREPVPGGVEVVEQVVAVTWEPFQIQGEWRDSWGGGPGFALRQFDEFRKMVERAPLVRVEFESLVLEGLLTNVRLLYQRAQRIGWVVTMSPHRFGEGVARVQKAGLPSVKPMLSHVGQLEQRDLELSALYDVAMGSGRPIALRSSSLLDSVKDALGAVTGAIASARKFAELGALKDATSQLVAIAFAFRSVRDTAQQLSQSLLRVRSDLDVAFESATESLAFVQWALGTRRVALLTARDAHRGERDARQLARQRPRAIHRPAAGERLDQISLRYYGTRDRWRDIYRFNRLTSLRLEGTEELVIPERAP